MPGMTDEQRGVGRAGCERGQAHGGKSA
jgi:hypothetical protein